MSVTALVLSAAPYARKIPGVEILLRQGELRTPADLLAARFAAIEDVRTEHFFFLDDDDDVPEHLPVAIEQCMAAGVPLAYTDEIVRAEDGTESVRTSGPYSQEAHLANPLLVHHLALCRTDAARAAVAVLPRGNYAPEMLLYWQMAKGGAAYVPITGYVWNRRPTGMHVWPQTVLSQMRAALWCQANK